jgi:UDP-galactopyranose mutase
VRQIAVPFTEISQRDDRPRAVSASRDSKLPKRGGAYTRITEHKHLTGQVHPKTTVTDEFPSGEGDPYYPVPRSDNAELYARYRKLADAEPDIEFVGRLATYRYYNMDQVVAQALATFARISGLRARQLAKRPICDPATVDV